MIDENDIEILRRAQADTLRPPTRDGHPHQDDLCAPYTFVPINGRVLTVASPDHARPEKDGLSGRIRVRFTTETPLLVAGLERQNDRPMTIAGTDYIPGASLRGMLRSVVETVAFGRVNFTDPHPAAVRDIQSITWNRYAADLTRERQTGWLFCVRPPEGSRGAKRYYLVDAAQTIPVELSDLSERLECTVDDWHSWSLHRRLEELQTSNLTGFKPGEDYALPNAPAGLCQLIIAGMTPAEARRGKNAKHQEHLAAWPDKPNSRQIDSMTAENFLRSLARDPSGHDGPPGCNISALEQTGPMKHFGEGDLDTQLLDPALHGLPVFVTVPRDADESRPALSLTAFYRFSYRQNFHDALKRAQPDSKQDPDRLDMAEALFGWAPPEVQTANVHLRGARERAWRGRVRMGFAERVDGNGARCTHRLPGIQPRPTFHPYYLKPGKDGLQHPVDLDNLDAIPAGRKRYPARGAATAPNLGVSDAQTQSAEFLEAGQVFEAEIRLHNTRPEEAGALIWAITLGQVPEATPGDGSDWAEPPDAGLRHMLGRGRNWGFGQIRMQIVRATLTRDISGKPADPADLITTFKTWVQEGLTAGGEEVTDFDAREEVQRFLGTCHAATGEALANRLRYTGQRDGMPDSQTILDAHVRIKKAFLSGKPLARSPRTPDSPGFIGLPGWPRFDWRNSHSGSED